MFASKLLILTVLSLQAWDSMGHIFNQKPLPKPDWCETFRDLEQPVLERPDVMPVAHIVRNTIGSNRANEPGCYSPITKKVLPFGLTLYPDGFCKKLQCTRNGFTAVHSCDKKVVPSGCRLVRDRKLRYPYCCGKVVCPVVKDDVYYNDYDYYYDPPARRYVAVGPDYDYYYHPPTRRYDADDLYYDEYDLGPVDYVDIDRRPVYYDDYVEPVVVYNDGRGDDYKLQEDTKVLYDKKNETSRRAPWNNNPTV